MPFKNTVLDRKCINGYVPRYISQRDSYNCGPVAIVNYWKFMGLKVSYKDVKIIGRMMGTKDKPRGTFAIDMAQMVGELWDAVSLEGLKLPAIILDNNHYWFCPNRCKGGFIGINYCDRETYHFISNRRMKSILKKAEVLLL